MATHNASDKQSARKALMIGVTLAAAIGAGSPALAFAAQGQQAVVAHAAYLKTSARLGWNNLITLVHVGTDMSVLPGGDAYWLHVRLPSGKTGYITANRYYVKVISQPASRPSQPQSQAQTAPAATQTPSSNSTGLSSAATGNFSLPPGVRLDPSLTPVAGTNASAQAKFQAVLQIAQSKLGTPYIWGHNEDRGQYGFDCSNYVEYVFHHALGYLFSTSSVTQFQHVGWPVSLTQIQPGDLLFFSDNTNPTGSAHVGIYIGNGQMIEEGGGLGKVGYLPINTGYWSHHLVAARRMF